MSRAWWWTADALHALLALLLFPLRFTPAGRARAAMENRHRGPGHQGAHWAFEVSSEGEFEQVRPWIQRLLEGGAKLEILFASPSVEKGMLALQDAHPAQVRLRALPLLTYRWGELASFVSAPRLVMCRYDFFPMLMRLCQRPDLSAGLVWATFKRRRHRLERPWWRAWYGHVYGVFRWLVPATREDEALFRALLPGTRVLAAADLRVGQIMGRLERREATLRRRFPHWDAFREVLATVPRERRWVLGSFWEEDLAILESPGLAERVRRREILILAVPHRLDPAWPARLTSRGIPVREVSSEGPRGGDADEGAVWVLNLKGILCELYAEAAFAYVGGGFGQSVHSVMEPYVAGARVFCGPAVHRSTEVELARDGVTVLPDRARLAHLLDGPHDAADMAARAPWLENQRSVGDGLLAQLEEPSPC